MIWDYMNEQKVPQLFVATGASKWGDPKGHPWTMGFQPDYQTEGIIYAKHILANVKDAKIAVLMQNDDYGKDYFNGFKAGLGKDADKIVKVATYEVADPDGRLADHPAQGHRRQRVLQHHDAEVRGAGDQEGRRARLEAGALPQQRVVVGRRGDEAGGLSTTAQGVITALYLQGPDRHAVGNSPDFLDWKAFMAKYMPSGDLTDASHVYGYAVANLMAEVLKRRGDDLTRANVMKQAASLKELDLPLLIPGHQDQHQRRPTSIRSSRCSSPASRARPGSCSASVISNESASQ